MSNHWPAWDIAHPANQEALKAGLATIKQVAEVANPITGELIRVDDPRECAVAIAELRDLEDRIKEVKRVLGATLIEEARKQGVKGTLRVPGAEVTISRKKEIVWDLELLAELHEAGLPEARWDELVRTTVEQKVNANVAKQLAGANDDYRTILEAARTDFEGEPYVSSVKRSGA